MPKAERNGGDVASKAAPKILMIRWNSSELLISRLLELAENSTEKSFSFLFFSLLELRDTIRTISFNQQLCFTASSHDVGVEASNVINDPKCNKGPKCNNFWP